MEIDSSRMDELDRIKDRAIMRLRKNRKRIQLSAKLTALIEFGPGVQIEKLWKSTPVSPVLGQRQHHLGPMGLAAGRKNLMAFMKSRRYLPSQIGDTVLRAKEAERMQVLRDQMAENVRRIRAIKDPRSPYSHTSISLF
jgi:hypothetical protein